MLEGRAQGYEEALGVMWVGPFLFTKLLTPALAAASRTQPVGTMWVSGFGLEQFAPEGRGVDMENLDYHVPRPPIDRYGISKAGVWLLAVEYARRHRQADGIVASPSTQATSAPSSPAARASRSSSSPAPSSTPSSGACAPSYSRPSRQSVQIWSRQPYRLRKGVTGMHNRSGLGTMMSFRNISPNISN